MKCSCREVEFEEGREYKRTKGIGHSPRICAPNLYEDGLRDPEEEGEEDSKPTRTKKAKKAKKPKKFKSCMSNGLKNALVLARHNAAFHADLEPYLNRKAERELIGWAATHTCNRLKKLRGMGSKKFGELLKLVRKFELRLACGCPCTGTPMAPEGDALAARLEAVVPYIKDGPTGGEDDPVATVRFVAALLRGSSVPVAAECCCPAEGSEAWDRGDRCSQHAVKA